MIPSSGRELGGVHLTRPLGGHCRARDFPPALESVGHFSAVLGGRKLVTSRSEVLGDGTIRGQKPVGVLWRLKPLHAPLPLARRLVGIFRPIIEVAVLPMFHTRQDLPLRSAVAFELVRDDHPRDVRRALEELAEELLRGLLVAPALDQNVEDVVVLVDSAPQVMALPIDC
jgi:hypothetical protein